MGHGAAASVVARIGRKGVVMKVDVEKSPLLSLYQLGPFSLSHRILSETSNGYPHTPGIWTHEQVEAWKPIVKAVHNKGTIFFCQIQHVGRISYTSYQPNGAHLIDQFLKSGINDRTDKYGGSRENRVRFLEEIITSVSSEIGSDRVGMRLSPFAKMADASDEDENGLSIYLGETLNKYNILYLHGVELRFHLAKEVVMTESLWAMKKAWKGNFFVAGGFNEEEGNEAVRTGKANAVVYGRLFLANPDLPKRFVLKAGLNAYNWATFYSQDLVVGYMDYPFLEEVLEFPQ